MTVSRIKRSHRQVGFTLVELVITIAILAIALVAMAQSLMMSAQYGADSLWQTKTVELVQAYSDEILTKKYDHNTPVGGFPPCGTASTACSSTLGPEGAEQRSGGSNDFNDVDDYHGLDESPPVDSLGSSRTDYAGYRVQVNVSYAGTELGLENGNAKRIQITVTPPGQTAVPFSVYRSNF